MINEPERGRAVTTDAAVVLQWVFTPVLAGPEASPYAGQAGKTVRSVGRRAAADGRVEVVLADGETVRALRHELRPG
jgi:hypothetical protein